MESKTRANIDSLIERIPFERRVRLAYRDEIALLRKLRRTGTPIDSNDENTQLAFLEIHRRWGVDSEEGRVELSRVNTDKIRELNTQVRANDIEALELFIQNPFAATEYFYSRLTNEIIKRLRSLVK